MAAGVEANIYNALLWRLQTLVFVPAMPIAGANVPFPPAGQTKPEAYLEVTYLPNRTVTRTVGPGRQWHRGIFQVNLHMSSKVVSGLAKPLEKADQIVAHYPKDLIIYESGIRVKISRKPYAIPMPPKDGSLMVPVTIEYESFN